MLFEIDQRKKQLLVKWNAPMELLLLNHIYKCFEWFLKRSDSDFRAFLPVNQILWLQIMHTSSYIPKQ